MTQKEERLILIAAKIYNYGLKTKELYIYKCMFNNSKTAFYEILNPY